MFANRRTRHSEPGIFELNGDDQADQRRRHATFQQQLRLAVSPDFCGDGEIMTEMCSDHSDLLKVRHHADFTSLPQRAVRECHALTIGPARRFFECRVTTLVHPDAIETIDRGTQRAPAIVLLRDQQIEQFCRGQVQLRFYARGLSVCFCGEPLPCTVDTRK